MRFEIRDLNQLKDVVAEIKPLFDEYRVVLLNGEMGSGKTTLVQETLRELGIHELEGSPTYALVNAYDSDLYGTIYHLDLYRLKTQEEAYDIGIEEILDGRSLCFIEWPEKIESFLYGKYLELNLSLQEDFTRILEVVKKSI
ncbi:MAG: tRNA ((37)-N6)-threonylcarbamoyltransferase complex ATPase subunit type 1 TsaE [Crocinitomicaceae bacterium]|jgi:tRNA threonylcarbamoyladenosine biosynthesis protein TsaE|nr:tRNA ((37)-N6)-threonylcarbamoyltransferase complex ATPase subunit type 1 TsaE [Crocinitomicaceae bacterium]